MRRRSQDRQVLDLEIPPSVLAMTDEIIEQPARRVSSSLGQTHWVASLSVELVDDLDGRALGCAISYQSLAKSVPAERQVNVSLRSQGSPLSLAPAGKVGANEDLGNLCRFPV